VDVPAALGDVVLKAMAKEPARRYASVAELREDLERALRGTAVRAPASHGVVALYGGYFEAKMRGVPFEYRSKRSILGLPWIHIVSGVRDPKTQMPKWAKGVVASGDYALGLYATGKVAVGFVALGWMAFGPVAIGALALGAQAIGAVAFGLRAMGLMVAGHSGLGLLDQWVAHPLDIGIPTEALLHHTAFSALIVCLVGAAFAPTVVHGIWSRTWPAAEHQRFLRRITRFWMPLSFAIPYALYLGGIELPFMGMLLILGGTCLVFSLLVKRKLGPPHAR
jgi:hypothetical protein